MWEFCFYMSISCFHLKCLNIIVFKEIMKYVNKSRDEKSTKKQYTKIKGSRIQEIIINLFGYTLCKNYQKELKFRSTLFLSL